jgi:hypothetical protein
MQNTKIREENLVKIIKKIQKFSGECIRSILHKMSTKFLKKNTNYKIWRVFGNFYQNLQAFIFENVTPWNMR